MPKVDDILTLLEQLAPRRLAEEWDNVGLQFGDRGWTADHVFVALDPTQEAIEAAAAAGADLLVTHHPLIFKPLKSIDVATPTGRILDIAFCNRISIFSAHTNLDSVSGGVNDVLAEAIGLISRGPLAPAPAMQAGKSSSEGIGRIGRFDQSRPLSHVAEDIGKRLNLKSVKFAGTADLLIETAAICSGGGSGLIGDFLASGAHVYISGDLNHHAAIDIAAMGRGMIDIGHFASERPVVFVLARYLEQNLKKSGLMAKVTAWADEPDPFTYL